MKVIFLDIDGVLNSVRYDRERGKNDGNIDESRLPLLKRAVEATDAEIILSSSWRRHWDKDESKMTADGKELDRLFKIFNMGIYDKTPDYGNVYGRENEIESWLNEHKDVDKFVIVDDLPFGWVKYSNRWVKTNANIGRGLEQSHVEEIIKLLT